MSVRVHVAAPDGTEELLRGISGWSVTEEATPVTADDMSGSVGGFTVTFDPQRTSPAALKALRRRTVRLDDLGQGMTTGRAESIGTQSQVPVLTVQSRLNLLSVQRKAKPYSGDLYGAVVYYLGLCGITDMNTVFVDPDLALEPVSLVGWYQPVWLQLKKMALVYGFEISLVSDKIVFRKLRERIGQQYRDSNVEWAIDDSQTAKTIQVNYYEAHVLHPGDVTIDNGTAAPGSNVVRPSSTQPLDMGGLLNPTYEEAMGLGLVYPPGGWNDTVEVFTVAANETKTVQIDLGASVTSIKQPIPVAIVGPYQVPGTSCYTITNADGSPMPPREWQAMGGKVHVAVNPDTTTATLTITGAGYARKGPFSLSMHVEADGSDFSSLRLIGEGIAYRKRMLTLQTGVSDDMAATDVGVTVDNEFIQSEYQAWDVAASTVSRFLGARQTISVTTTGINRLGDTGSYIFPTLGWLSGAIPPGMTLADVGAWLTGQSGGTTLEAIDTWLAGQTADGFENQAFGNIAGARVIHDGSWYRILSATIGPDYLTYAAQMDMLCGDISAALPGATLADLSAAFTGKTVMDWDARPVPDGVSA